MKSRALRLSPLLLILILGFIFWRGLAHDPRHLPSMYLNKPLPNFSLPVLTEPSKVLNNDLLKGHSSLLNIFASWCSSCSEEQGFLLKLAAEGLPIYGINYKDSPKEALRWLEVYGNPYLRIGEDSAGFTAIDLGIYGTPETFLIDKEGRVRYRYAGVLDEKIWSKEFLPRLHAMGELG